VSKEEGFGSLLFFLYLYCPLNKEIMKTKEFKLEKEFAQKWVDALKSGKYPQGEGFLENSYGQYCCLGVACRMNHPKVDLRNKAFIDVSKESRGHISKYLNRSIPALLRGTDATQPFVQKVSKMNDDGCSFIQIAYWIEKNVEFV